MQEIGIVGGGFSGTMVAVNLVRFAKIPCRVTIVNAGRPFVRGAAYGTKRLEHLLNVAARNMSAFPDRPNHFIEWLETRSDFDHVPFEILKESFVPRRIYGDYLGSIAHGHFQSSDGEGDYVQVRRVAARVVDLECIENQRARISLDDGSCLVADQVVLATGNQKPASFEGPNGPFRHPAYCDDPWEDWESKLPASTADVVLLGTGLTMVDLFLHLRALNWKGTIHAVSRNGLLPESHFRGIDYPDYLEARPRLHRLEDVVKIVESHCEILRDMGQNPAIAVDKLRSHTQRLWKGLTIEDKLEFIKTYSARWNTLRHRIAQSIHQELMLAIEDGRLVIHRGAVKELRDSGPRVQVITQDKSGLISSLEGGFVVNCTGPKSRVSDMEDLLLQRLLSKGYARPDELDLGIEVTDEFRIVNAAGEASSSLFAIGPMLKGTLWETIAVPELRLQAYQIAKTLSGIDSNASLRYQITSSTDLIEYMI